MYEPPFAIQVMALQKLLATVDDLPMAAASCCTIGQILFLKRRAELVGWLRSAAYGGRHGRQIILKAAQVAPLSGYQVVSAERM